jgi:hypothetical protein
VVIPADDRIDRDVFAVLGAENSANVAIDSILDLLFASTPALSGLVAVIGRPGVTRRGRRSRHVMPGRVWTILDPVDRFVARYAVTPDRHPESPGHHQTGSPDLGDFAGLGHRRISKICRDGTSSACVTVEAPSKAG